MKKGASNGVKQAFLPIFSGLKVSTTILDLLLFLQEMVLCMPLQKQKKSAAYLNFCAAIEAALDNEP